MNKSIILLTLCSFLMTSCCTVRYSKYQQVDVASDPSGALIRVDGTPQGFTPQKLSLERSRPHKLILEKEGYRTELLHLYSRTSPKKLSSNALIPLGAAVVGTGTGLCLTGGNAGDYTGLIIAACGVYALFLGSAIGAVGLGIDYFGGKACSLYPDAVHVKLQVI